MEARPRKMILTPRKPRPLTQDFKVKKKGPTAKRWKELPGEPRVYTRCSFSCPACKQTLAARSWGPNGRNVEVETSAAWVLVSVSGDVRLPCPICLAFTQCHDRSNWHKATFTSDQLHTSLRPRPRQHWARKHKINVRSAEGEAMKTFSKLLLCEALHDRSSGESLPEPEVI